MFKSTLCIIRQPRLRLLTLKRVKASAFNIESLTKESYSSSSSKFEVLNEKSFS